MGAGFCVPKLHNILFLHIVRTTDNNYHCRLV